MNHIGKKKPFVYVNKADMNLGRQRSHKHLRDPLLNRQGLIYRGNLRAEVTAPKKGSYRVINPQIVRQPTMV